MFFNFERSIAFILLWWHLRWWICLCVSTDKLIWLFLYQFLHKISFKNIDFALNSRCRCIMYLNLIIWRIKCLILWSSVRYQWVFLIMKQLILMKMHTTFVLYAFWIVCIWIIWIKSIINTISGWLLKNHRLTEVLALDLRIVIDWGIHKCQCFAISIHARGIVLNTYRIVCSVHIRFNSLI